MNHKKRNISAIKHTLKFPSQNIQTRIMPSKQQERGMSQQQLKMIKG